MFERKMTIIRLPKKVYANQFFITLSFEKSILHKLGLYRVLPMNTNEYREFNSTPPLTSFTRQEEEKGRKLLERMGIPQRGWFVCFHARESAYLKAHLGTDNVSYYQFRDCDIENYLKAAQYVTSKGGYAVRMGEKVEKALPDQRDKRIIDYASTYRTDFGDIYLVAHCLFFLGSTAGICFFSSIFNKPQCQANLIPLKYPPLRTGDLFIPKKIWSLRKKRYLTFREIITSEIITFVDSASYARAGLRPVENTAQEILDVTTEMYESLKGTFHYTPEDEQLQKRFKSLFPESSHCHGFPSRIGAQFLQENKNLLR